MRIFSRAVGALGLAALLAGCTKVGTTGEGGRHAYTRPHELRFASAADIHGLNPVIDESAYELQINAMTMAWLIKTDAHGDPTVPELVTEVPTQKNGDISADGKTITWKLRHGVVWADGAPFTADDVVYTTRQVLNPANNVVSRDGWDQIVKIDEPDKYTVVYHLKAPYSSYAVTFFSTGGANPCVLPKHLLAKYPNLNSVPYNAQPVGIGPFKVLQWKRGDSVELVANPTYFRGRPKLDRVTYLTVQDRNTVEQLLRSHSIDAWTDMTPHYYPESKATAGITGISIPSFTYDHLDFNLTHPVLKDLAVRQALEMATNRPELIDKVQLGLYDLDESPIVPASRYHLALPVVPYDLAKANALLDRAGWKRGADGVRAKNGLRLALTIAIAAGSQDTDSELELVRASWKQLGVDFTVKHYLAALFFAPLAEGGIIYAGKFDVTLFAWGEDTNEDLSNLYACYRFPPDGQDDPRWCDQKATALMTASKTTYDQGKRAVDLNLIQRAVVAQVPTIVLDSRRYFAAYNSDLKNWHPNSISPFDDMMQVDI